MKWKAITGLVLGLVCIPPVYSQYIGRDLSQNFLLTTGPLGFGGAFRALADTNAALWMNPAGLVQQKGKMSASLDYSRMNHSSNLFSVGIVDFQTNQRFAFGLSYGYETAEVGVDGTTQQVALSAAMPLGSMLSFGSSVKGYWVDIDSILQQGPKGVDMDLGLLSFPVPFLSFALTLHNAFRGHNCEEFPLLFGAGGALILKPHARISMDFTKNFQSSGPQEVNGYFGGEVTVAKGIDLRGGFGLDRQQNNNFFSFGTAISSEKILLGFSFVRKLNPTSENFSANVEVYF